jgi:sugar/nucleoside kinase (ribokinase family)
MRGKVKKFRAMKVLVRNMNRAGYCFAGANAYGISKNFALVKMNALGVALGILNVQRFGPRLPASNDLSPYVEQYGRKFKWA